MRPGLTLTVPEAAASTAIIQFKIVLSGDNALDEYMLRHNHVQSTVFRSFQQISWLHERLAKAMPDMVIPPLPDPPTISLMNDQDQVERKRLQVERFFIKLVARAEFAEHPDFVHFLSTNMAPAEVGQTKQGVLAFLRFNRVMRPKKKTPLIRTYTSDRAVQGDHRDDIHQQLAHMLHLEANFGSISQTLTQMIQQREELGDMIAYMGDAQIEVTQSKYRLGNGASEKQRHDQRVLDRRMQTFGLTLDELGFIVTRQGKEETLCFVDVMTEYKDAMESVKTVLQVQQQALKQYAECKKQHTRKHDKTERLKTRLGLHALEVTTSMEEESEAEEALGAARQRYDTCQTKVTTELDQFVLHQRQDIQRAVRDYVSLSARFERAKLQCLEKALEEMRHAQPKSLWPMYMSSLAQGEGGDEELSSSSASSGSRRTRKKKLKQPQLSQPQGASQRIPQKALHTSTSMPTWSRPSPNASAHDLHRMRGTKSTQSATVLSESPQSLLPTEPHTVPAQETTASSSPQRSPGLSSSYDDRFAWPWQSHHS